MSFGRLLETALAGSQRREIAAALPAFEQLSAERRLLRGASYEGLRRLAGRPPDLAANVIALEPCAPEKLPAIPAVAGARLLEILSNRPGLLTEWLGVAAGHGWRVAHDYLPDVLEYASSRPDIHDLVMQVGGARLVWLAELKPEWHFATRVEISAALLDGLSAEAEPLLQQGLQDPRKELREKALRLIRRVPDSHFGRRWTERARQVIALTEHAIEVRVPEALDPGWIVDGLDPRPPKGIGATAWVLQQVLALTPPAIWPHDALGVLARSDWSQPLVSGLAQAAVAYADADWCEILLVSETRADVGRGVHATSLLAALAPERAEAVVGRLLDAPASGPATLAASLKHPWSADFSRAVLGRLPGLLTMWQYATSPLLHEAPLRLDPGVLLEAQQLLENHREPDWARPALRRIVNTLEFRVAMRTELERA